MNFYTPTNFENVITSLDLNIEMSEYINTSKNLRKSRYPDLRKRSKEKILKFLNSNKSPYYKWYVLHVSSKLHDIERQYVKKNPRVWNQIIVRNKSLGKKKLKALGRHLRLSDEQIDEINKYL
jgi:hypothetical protein